MPIKNNGSAEIGGVFSVVKNADGTETQQEVKEVWNVARDAAGVETRQLIWQSYPKPPIAGYSHWVDLNTAIFNANNDLMNFNGNQFGYWARPAGNQGVWAQIDPETGYNCLFGNGYAQFQMLTNIPAGSNFTIFMCVTLQSGTDLVELMGGGYGTGYRWRMIKDASATATMTMYTMDTYRGGGLYGGGSIHKGIFAVRYTNPGFGSPQIEFWPGGNWDGYAYYPQTKNTAWTAWDRIFNFPPGSGLLGFQGYLYEILAYPKFLTDVEMLGCYNYLVKKWRR